MKTILAALDASPQRPAVLEETARLAVRFEASVHVVCVVRPEIGWTGALAGIFPEVTQALMDQARDVLAKACSDLAGMGLACATHEAVGQVAQEIARLAGDLQADLIVIGHRNLSWLDQLVEHSVGKDLLSLAPCNVLVVAG